MEAETNFNKRAARRIDADAHVKRSLIALNKKPVTLFLRAANSRQRLIVTMTDKEALALAAELYAASDQHEKEIRIPIKPLDFIGKNTLP